MAKNPTERLLRNIVSSWFSMVVTACLAFFISPFLVHTLGEDSYGIWALALSVVAYTGFLDVGMKQSLTRYVPKYYGTRDNESLNEVINSSNFVYLITGTLVVIVSLVIGLCLVGVFNIPSHLIGIASAVFIIVGLHQAGQFFFMAPAALGPFHRYDLANGIEVVRVLVGAALTVVLLKMGYGLLALALLTLGQTLVASSIRVMIRKRIVPEVKYRLKYVKKARIKEMLSYGWVSFLIVVATMTIFNTDNIIIGIFESSAAVTFYSIAGTLINYLRVIAGSVGVPLTPVISHLESSDGAAKIGPLYASMVSKLYYLFTALCVSILVFGDSFIYLWMGPEFGSTVKVLFILIIPASIYLPQVLANSVLLGIGRHKPLLYVLVAEAVSKIVLSVILVQIWGIYGVAWGTAIPQIAIYTVVYPVVFHRIIKGSLSAFYKLALKMMAIAAAFSAPPALLMQAYNNIPGWSGFILNVIVVSAFIGIGFWFLVLDADNRSKIIAKISHRR